MNSTTYAKRTLYKPIDFFFRAVVEAKGKSKKVAFVDAFQILNDRYLGRMSVCNYFYIAENSVRINELNVIAFDELPNYDLVMRENFLIPDNVVYSLPVSVRFLENDKDFDILVATLKDNKYKKSNLILSFFASTLARIDEKGLARYNQLRKLGFKICISAFGEDYNALDLFGMLNFDYLRCEAQYFDATDNKKRVLQMLLKFCDSNKITLIMEGVDTPAQHQRFKREGVKLLTGRAVSKLSRWVTNDLLYLDTPEGAKKEAYLKKLQVALDEKAQEEELELENLHREALERARQEDGKVMPAAPRPELAKSPYQVRLEQQKLNAQKSAEAQVEKMEQSARLINQQVEDPERNAKLITEMSRMGFEDNIQEQMGLSFGGQVKGLDKYKNKAQEPAEQKAEPKRKRRKEVVVDANEGSVAAPIRPTAPKGFQKPKPRKKIKAELNKEEKLFNEFRNDNLFGDLSMSTGMKGFGVTMHITNKEKDQPDLTGSYNERGQWVDEDGNVFNGYFDVEGNWVEYEQFDSKKEGHYNDKAQWVDADGTVYDGYFDEEGRWIDYTYTDNNGEIVDNGYFDDTINKWVPFGYFALDGTYHRF